MVKGWKEDLQARQYEQTSQGTNQEKVRCPWLQVPTGLIVLTQEEAGRWGTRGCGANCIWPGIQLCYLLCGPMQGFNLSGLSLICEDGNGATPSFVLAISS